jgi:ornithine--oxo-acid transaminase
MVPTYWTMDPVIAKGKDIHVWDVEGNKYLEFHSSFCSVNQGHSHPVIIKALTDQAQKLTMTSRVFHNENSGKYAQFMHDTFGYDKVLPMNSGVEADESAIKIARKWGYTVKGITDNQAKVLLPNGVFWGRSITASGACDDPKRYNNFGPFTPGFELIDYDDLEALDKKLGSDPNFCAFMVEPI